MGGLLLLDLDGTLVEDALVEEDGKLQRPQDQLFHEPVLRPNVYQVIHRAALEGNRFAIVTNQGGVAWGYHTQAEVRARIARAVAALDFFFGRPFSVHVAWSHPRATVPQFREVADDDLTPTRRKPAPTMLVDAWQAHGVRAEESEAMSPDEILMVGDREEDMQAAEAAHVDFAPAGDFFTW